jgi:hypothetical protein
MRPGQQNRRPRGRTNNGGSNNGNNSNNNNRSRQQNPLARSYESSGPDVKIRGNAQHVAERYAQLARDSLSSGDRVMAENYLQHAEHYNRIIAAAMVQQAQFSEQQRREWDEESGPESDGEEGDENAGLDSGSDNGQNQDQQAPVSQAVDKSQNNQAQNIRERNIPQNRNNQERNSQERPERQPRQDRSSQDRNTQERQPRAVFVAPVGESQPVIEGTPAEFANAESAGLARTLGLHTIKSTGGVEKPVSEAHDHSDADAVPAVEAAPRAPRPRRAPRKTADEDARVAPLEPAPETAGE